MGYHVVPETFVVGEMVDFCDGEYRRKVQVTAVNGNEVTARVRAQPMVFTPRPSDGKHVKVGSPDYEVTPTMISRPAPKAKTSRWRDIRDFLHGMFWAPW